ncbi:hypothetical protein MRX96_016538 [Rhipicephalus microplus]
MRTAPNQVTVLAHRNLLSQSDSLRSPLRENHCTLRGDSGWSGSVFTISQFPAVPHDWCCGARAISDGYRKEHGARRRGAPLLARRGWWTRSRKPVWVRDGKALARVVSWGGDGCVPLARGGRHLLAVGIIADFGAACDPCWRES